MDDPQGTLFELTDEIVESCVFSHYKGMIHGNDFSIVTYGSDNPVHLTKSFAMEGTLRDEWWNIVSGDVVIDIGAGYGSYSLSALASGASFVLAVEPGKSEFFDLTTQLIVNGFLNKCIALNVLVGSENEIGEYCPASHSVFQTVQNSVEKRMMFTLDRIVERFGLDKIDWIKVDVEGYELNVLRGGQEVLKRYSPTILIETHVGIVPGIDGEVSDLMGSLGYKMIGEKRGRMEVGSNELWTLWKKGE